MKKDDLRKTGYRVKKWGIDIKDAEAFIEGTAEYPIMYRALGTEPKTSHPFNLYGDIQIEGKAVQDSLKQNAELIPLIAMNWSGAASSTSSDPAGHLPIRCPGCRLRLLQVLQNPGRPGRRGRVPTVPRPYNFKRSVFMAYSAAGPRSIPTMPLKLRRKRAHIFWPLPQLTRVL